MQARRSLDRIAKWTIPLRVLSLFCQISCCRVDPIRACGLMTGSPSDNDQEGRSDASVIFLRDPKSNERVARFKQGPEMDPFVRPKHSSLRATILLVIDELVSNLLKYGFSAAPHQRSYLNVTFDDDWLEIELKDNGHRFNPLLQPEPKLLDQELSNRQVGGLGLYLVLKMMDETHYEWIQPWNCLRLRKRFNEGRE